MTYEELLEILKDVKFDYKYEPVGYDPIRPIIYPDHTHSFVGGYSDVNSNALGSDNDEILVNFCYDACDDVPPKYQRNKKK